MIKEVVFKDPQPVLRVPKTESEYFGFKEHPWINVLAVGRKEGGTNPWFTLVTGGGKIKKLIMLDPEKTALLMEVEGDRVPYSDLVYPHVPKISEERKSQLLAEIEEEARIEKRKAEITKRTSPKRYTVLPNFDGAKFVGQGEYSVTDPNRDTPVLYTHGMSYCVGLGLCNQNTKRGSIAHIDAGVKIGSVWRMIYDTSADSIKATIIGGTRYKEGIVYKLHEFLGDLGINPVMDCGNLSGFALDTRTAEIKVLPYIPQNVRTDQQLSVSSLSRQIAALSGGGPLRKV